MIRWKAAHPFTPPTVRASPPRGGKPRPERTLLPPQAPRLQPQPPRWNQFKQRIVALKAPPAVRTRANQEKASEKIHQAMRVFLADLTARPLTPREIDRHLLRFTEASHALTKSDTDATGQARARLVFKQCLRMQLAQLPPENLQRLQERANNAPEGPTGAFLRVLGRELKAAPHMAAILRAFDRAFLASEKGNRDEVENQLAKAQGSAAQVVQHLNLVKPGEDAFAQGEALLKEICAQWMQQHPPGPLAGFFRAIPAATQALWQKTLSPRLFVSNGEVDRRLEEAIEHTEKALSDTLQTACKTALSAPSPETLGAVADAWTALKTCCEAFDRPPGDAREVMPLLARLVQNAAGLDLSGLLGPDTLTNPQLHDLHKALTTLGIPHDSQAFAAEIKSRKKDSQDPYTFALDMALRNLARGELSQALECLRDADTRFESVVRAHEELAGHRLDVDRRTQLAHAMFQQVFSEAPPKTCARAFGVLNHLQTRLLAEVLTDLGTRAGDDAAMVKLGRIGTTLVLLKCALAEHLENTHEVKSLSRKHARRPAEFLSPQAFQLAQHFTDGRVQRPPA